MRVESSGWVQNMQVYYSENDGVRGVALRRKMERRVVVSRA